MLSEYKTVYRGGEAEIIEKKSRFIASVSPVKNEADALLFIASVKKKYWNASHHCYAYVTGKEVPESRVSDDGEPSGTAGKPILYILLREKLYDTLIVVTRYFGGTLLGTGGLVRAYSLSAKEGILASRVITKTYGRRLSIGSDYVQAGKIRYILTQKNVQVLDTVYTDKVMFQIVLPEDRIDVICEAITEGTGGKACIGTGDSCYFADIDGTVHTFED